jgi:hypothetical protein
MRWQDGSVTFSDDVNAGLIDTRDHLDGGRRQPRILARPSWRLKPSIGVQAGVASLMNDGPRIIRTRRGGATTRTAEFGASPPANPPILPGARAG